MANELVKQMAIDKIRKLIEEAKAKTDEAKSFRTRHVIARHLAHALRLLETEE